MTAGKAIDNVTTMTKNRRRVECPLILSLSSGVTPSNADNVLLLYPRRGTNRYPNFINLSAQLCSLLWRFLVHNAQLSPFTRALLTIDQATRNALKTEDSMRD